MRQLLFILLAMFPSLVWAKPAPSVYVCAHPDDCLLFMSPHLYADVAAGEAKTVFVYLTSGDAGLAFSGDDAAAYPYARELASLAATGWMADIGKTSIRDQQERDRVDINGHAITRVRYANSASYFLRLPDGNMYADGFARYGNQSLQKLKRGVIASITPIDGGAAYSWQDLVATLSGILARETEGAPTVTLHLSDPDITKNTGDHSDHTTGAIAAMEAVAADGRCYRIHNHIDYAIAEKPMNLNGVGLQHKAGGFAVLTATQRHYLDHHNWDAPHQSYLTRDYYSTTTKGCTR